MRHWPTNAREHTKDVQPCRNRTCLIARLTCLSVLLTGTGDAHRAQRRPQSHCRQVQQLIPTKMWATHVDGSTEQSLWSMALDRARFAPWSLLATALQLSKSTDLSTSILIKVRGVIECACSDSGPFSNSVASTCGCVCHVNVCLCSKRDFNDSVRWSMGDCWQYLCERHCSAKLWDCPPVCNGRQPPGEHDMQWTG